MNEPSPHAAARPPRFRVWHLCLLTGFVAIAIANIQDQRRHEPALIALAAGGFVLYAVLAWIGWRIAVRSRWKGVPRLAIYLTAMAALFLVACLAYLAIEQRYLGLL